MSLIQLQGNSKLDYIRWLELYKARFGKSPDAAARTEAFFSATRGDKPWWALQ